MNLERPLAIGSRLGGHFVQGHVDGTGRIEAVIPEGEFYRVRISFPPALAAYFIEKGSVAVDGISLTVASLRTRPSTSKSSRIPGRPRRCGTRSRGPS